MKPTVVIGTLIAVGTPALAAVAAVAVMAAEAVSSNPVLMVQKSTVTMKRLEAKFREWPGTLATMGQVVGAANQATADLLAATTALTEDEIAEDDVYNVAKEATYLGYAAVVTLDLIVDYKTEFDRIAVSATVKRKVGETATKMADFLAKLVARFPTESQIMATAITDPVNEKFTAADGEYAA